MVWTLFGISFVAINIYILISGYFLAESSFSSWRLVKMEMQIWFYSMGILALFWIFGDVEHDVEYLVYCLTPVISDFYWFATMYVGMYLLSPILNTFVRSITKRQFQCILLLLFVLLSVWTNIFYYTSGMNIVEGVSIAWFVAVYLFGAYIRMYYVPDGRAGKWFMIGGGLTLLIPISRFVIDALLSTQWMGTRHLEDLLPAIIATVLAIYAICMIIELIRHFLFKPVELWVKPYCDKFDAKLRELWHGNKESDRNV